MRVERLWVLLRGIEDEVAVAGAHLDGAAVEGGDVAGGGFQRVAGHLDRRQVRLYEYLAVGKRAWVAGTHAVLHHPQLSDVLVTAGSTSRRALGVEDDLPLAV